MNQTATIFVTITVIALVLVGFVLQAYKCSKARQAEQQRLTVTLVSEDEYVDQLRYAISEGKKDIKLELIRMADGSEFDMSRHYVPADFHEHMQNAIGAITRYLRNEKALQVKDQRNYTYVPNKVPLQIFATGRGDVPSEMPDQEFEFEMASWMNFSTQEQGIDISRFNIGTMDNVGLAEGRVVINYNRVVCQLGDEALRIDTGVPYCYSDKRFLYAHDHAAMKQFVESQEDVEDDYMELKMLTPELLQSIKAEFGELEVKNSSIFRSNELFNILYEFTDGQKLLISSAEGFFKTSDFTELTDSPLLSALRKVVPGSLTTFNKHTLEIFKHKLTWYIDTDNGIKVDSTVYKERGYP